MHLQSVGGAGNEGDRSAPGKAQTGAESLPLHTAHSRQYFPALGLGILLVARCYGFLRAPGSADPVGDSQKEETSEKMPLFLCDRRQIIGHLHQPVEEDFRGLL